MILEYRAKVEGCALASASGIGRDGLMTDVWRVLIYFITLVEAAAAGIII